MKRRVLCVFLFVLYLLVACSMLSGRIEAEMATLVQIEKRTSSKQTGRPMAINVRAVFTDSKGDHLYEVRDGDRWDSGLRTYDVPGFGINIVDGIATLYGTRDYVFVKSASRQPRDGEMAIIVEDFTVAPDTYLYYYEHGLPDEIDLPAYLKIIAQSENALLVENSEGTFPFLSHTAKTWTVTTDFSTCVFSLTEAEIFLNEMPNVIKAISILIFGIVLYVFSCFLVIDTSRNKWLIRINAVLIILSLVAFQSTLNSIDFPASLMPNESILDIPHYIETFNRITTSMDSVGDPTVKNWISQSVIICWVVAGISAAITGAIVMVEGLLCYHRTKAELEESEEE